MAFFAVYFNCSLLYAIFLGKLHFLPSLLDTCSSLYPELLAGDFLRWRGKYGLFYREACCLSMEWFNFCSLLLRNCLLASYKDLYLSKMVSCYSPCRYRCNLRIAFIPLSSLPLGLARRRGCSWAISAASVCALAFWGGSAQGMDCSALCSNFRLPLLTWLFI